MKKLKVLWKRKSRQRKRLRGTDRAYNVCLNFGVDSMSWDVFTFQNTFLVFMTEVMPTYLLISLLMFSGLSVEGEYSWLLLRTNLPGEYPQHSVTDLELEFNGCPSGSSRPEFWSQKCLINMMVVQESSQMLIYPSYFPKGCVGRQCPSFPKTPAPSGWDQEVEHHFF